MEESLKHREDVVQERISKNYKRKNSAVLTQMFEKRDEPLKLEGAEDVQDPDKRNEDGQ